MKRILLLKSSIHLEMKKTKVGKDQQTSNKEKDNWKGKSNNNHQSKKMNKILTPWKQ